MEISPTRIVHLRTTKNHSSALEFIQLATNDNTSPSPTTLLNLGALYINGRRLLTDQMLRPNDYLRVHLKPRRFPAAVIDWHKQILSESEHWLVIDKPHGVPVHASLDNSVENLIFQLSQHLNMPVHPTHRLDHCARGLVLLAKSNLAQSKLQKLFASHKIYREYLAQVKGNPLPQKLIDYLMPSERVPRQLCASDFLGAKLCEGEIIHSKPVGPEISEVRVHLKTGRTHQVRLQLASRGHPIVGDTLYDPIDKPVQPEHICLISSRIRFKDPILGSLDFSLSENC